MRRRSRAWHIVPLAVVATITAAAPAPAAFPGANGRLAIQRPAGDQFDLFTLRPDGSGLRPLVTTARMEEKPVWAPDGRHVAFSRSAKGGHPTEIWSADARGAHLQRLTRWDDVADAPAYSPDGRIAYFTTKDFPPPASEEDPPPPAELYSMAPDGTDQRRLTNDHQIQTDPVWSPDGRTIAFVQWQAVAGEPGVYDLGLFAMNSDGSGIRVLQPFSADRDIVNANWSPDGRHIVVEIASASPPGDSGGSGRQSDLAVMRADGTHVRRLTRTKALETHPVWSPDGRFIAFTGDRHVKRGPREWLGDDFELYIMRATGRDVRRITHNHVADMFPDWGRRPGS